MSSLHNSEIIYPKEDTVAQIPFWSSDPNILLNKDYIFEFFPTETMTYEQKMNAVSRLVILLTIVGFLFSRNLRLIIISAIILSSIFLLYNYQKKEQDKKERKKVTLEKQMENFETDSSSNFSKNPARVLLKEKNIDIPESQDVFDQPTPVNPFSNVMITDYDYNPEKKPAGPSYNEDVNRNILKQAKQLVINANPDQPNIADKLFRGLGESLEFEQSMRQFTSNPSTTIPNDQKGFAEFCYGGLISAKEGNMFSLARNLSRHTGN
jgi:hypothetical protein